MIRNKLDPSNTWSTCMGRSDVLTLKRLELFITLFLHTRPWYSNIYTWKYAFIIEFIDSDNMNMPCSINRVCLITILDYAWQYDNPKGTVHSTLSSLIVHSDHKLSINSPRWNKQCNDTSPIFRPPHPPGSRKFCVFSWLSAFHHQRSFEKPESELSLPVTLRL